MRHCRVVGVVLIGYLVLLRFGVAYVFALPAGRDDNDPSPVRDSAAPLMVALGDSFMSGEGAERYLPDTDVPADRCHRATSAHPYLVAKQLGMRLVSAACSGRHDGGLHIPSARNLASVDLRWGRPTRRARCTTHHP